MGIDDKRVSPEDVARDFLRTSPGVDPFAEAVEAEFQRVRRRRLRLGLLVLVVLIGAGAGTYVGLRHKPAHRSTNPPAGQSSPGGAQATANRLAVANGCPASPTAPVNRVQYAAPANMVRDHTLYAATVVTTAGTFRIALQQSKAPKSVNSFIFLAEKGYFTCNAFNRVVANGIDATGDPSGTGHGDPGYVIPAEQPARASNPAHQYPLDTVALANSGGYDVGGSQWFVVTGPVGESLPNSFSVLGTVISGQSVLEKINAEGTPSGHPTVIERVLKVTIQVKTL